MPRHIHHDCEEAFLVLEGEKFIEVDGRVVREPAGSFVLVPRGVPHSHWNSEDTAVRFLLIFSPPGMGEYFRERGEILLRAAKTDASDFEGGTFRELERLAERYGMEFVPEGAAGS